MQLIKIDQMKLMLVLLLFSLYLGSLQEAAGVPHVEIPADGFAHETTAPQQTVDTLPNHSLKETYPTKPTSLDKANTP